MTWKATKATLMRVDGSAAAERLVGTGDERFLPRWDDRTANTLQTEYMRPDVRLLEPAR